MPRTNDEFCAGRRARKLERNPYSEESQWRHWWAWEQGRKAKTRKPKAREKSDLDELMEPLPVAHNMDFMGVRR